MQLRPVYRLVRTPRPWNGGRWGGQWEAPKQVAVQRRMSHPPNRLSPKLAERGTGPSRVHRKEVAVDQSSVQVSSIDLRLGRREGGSLELARCSRALLTRPGPSSQMQTYRRQRTTHPPLVAPTTGTSSLHSVRLIRRRKLQAFRSSLRSSGRWFCAPTFEAKQKAPEPCQPSAVCTCVFAVTRFIISRMLPSTHLLRLGSPAASRRLFAATQLSAFVVQSPCADPPYRPTMPKFPLPPVTLICVR
jgi:hypothetical protein